MGEIVVGIDIGTSKVSTLIGRVNSLSQVEPIGKGLEVCSGIKKGVIVDIENTAASIKASVKQAEDMSGLKIKSAYINIPGLHLSIANSHNWINIPHENREITKGDIERAVDEVRQMRIPEDTYIIDVIPNQYIVDGCEGIIDPLGITASRLEVEADVVLAKAASIQSIMKCLETAGIGIEGIVTEGLASGSILLTPDEKQMGVLMVDIGGEITDITVFKNNKILLSDSLPVGGEHITNDIAIGLKTPFADAEKFKKRYNLALTSLIKYDQDEVINDISGTGVKSVKISEMVEIVEARVYEIFSLCKKLVEDEGIDKEGITSVVLTGRGISYLDGAIEMAGEVFDVPVRVALIKGGMDIKPEHITCAGMIKYVSQHYKNTSMVEAKEQVKQRINTKGIKNKTGFGQKLLNILKDLF